MDQVYETIEKGGFTASIEYFEFADDPRKCYDNVGTMVCWHSRYNLGDENPFETPDLARQHFEETGALVLPLYLFDHSGITMNTTGFHCPWDSGQVGYIYVEPEKIREEWGDGPDAEEKARHYLVGEVKTYDYYISGQNFAIDIVNEEGIQVDSSCGHYGIDDAREAANEMLTVLVKVAHHNFLGAGI